MNDATGYDDAGHAEDDYEYEPGVPLRERLRGARDAVFRDWRPDARTVGLVLVVIYIVRLANGLLTINLILNGLTHALHHDPLFPARLRGREIVVESMRLVAVPAHLLVVSGGIGLVLRQRWGWPAAVAGLVVVALTEIVDTVADVLTSDWASGYTLRFDLVEVIGALSTVAAVAVLLWSRPAPDSVSRGSAGSG